MAALSSRGQCIEAKFYFYSATHNNTINTHQHTHSRGVVVYKTVNLHALTMKYERVSCLSINATPYNFL